MVDFLFEVDTIPMAESVDTAKKHINSVNGAVIGTQTAVTATNAAVVSMQAAVIAAEREASKTICENVDRGFFALIKSQISQKAVTAFTEMTSKQMILLQLAKALDSVKQQMEDDYSMITRRYAKLFNSLNKALEIRVKELDRPAMRLAEIKKNMVFDKLKDDSSMLFSISAEALPLAQTALSGKLKQKTREALLTLSDSIDENRFYSETVDRILVKNENEFPGASDNRYLPVVFFVTDSLLNAGDSIESVFMVQSDVWQNSAPIVSEINRVQNSLRWAVSGMEERTQSRMEFLALCEKEPGNERVTNEMIRLFDESSWEECKDEL